MNTKRWILLSTAILFLRTAALDAQLEDIPLEAPSNWGGETIPLPTGFARDMKFRGVETIRFAPGMFKPQEDDFFTYAFAFRLEPGTSVGQADLRRELLTYYRGLAKAVMRDPDLDVSDFKVELSSRKTAASLTGYGGTIDWLEPFRTKKKQKLYLEIDVWHTGEKKTPYVFCSVSPQKTSHAVWKPCRTIRDKLVKRIPPIVNASWSSFRGPNASGVADGQDIPDVFGGEEQKHVRWKTRIPGLAHSSPIVQGDRIWVTTAISSSSKATVRVGLYGDGDASEDRSVHEWRLICLDKKSGKIVWSSLATKGEPKEKRHIKATYANSTPATDGRFIVAFFGSQGLYAFDMAGKKLWEKDLGRLDVGAYDAPDYEWGTASSPIIWGDLAIVQCDTQKESFLLAADIRTGKTVWKADRDELPSWGTPTVCEGPKGPELVTNASKLIRGYDPATGKQLWQLGGSSKITAPTPVTANGLAIVASGRHPERPIFAIRLGSRGDLTLPKGERSSESIAWSKVKRGGYMPTPLVYRGTVYVLNNNGVFDAYELETGKEIFRSRIVLGGSGFSASPVAADGKIYIAGEDGDVYVLRAGQKLEVIAKNSLSAPILATPALSDGVLFVRTQGHLVAIGK